MFFPFPLGSQFTEMPMECCGACQSVTRIMSFSCVPMHCISDSHSFRSPCCFHFTNRCVLRFSLYKDDVQHLLCSLHFVPSATYPAFIDIPGTHETVLGCHITTSHKGFPFPFLAAGLTQQNANQVAVAFLPPLDTISNSRVLQVVRALTCCPKSRPDDEALILLFFLALYRSSGQCAQTQRCVE